MSLEVRTIPLWTTTSSSSVYSMPIQSSEEMMTVADRVRDETGLNVTFCRPQSGGNTIANAGIAINFNGDTAPANTAPATSDFKGYYPSSIYIGHYAVGGSSTNIHIHICSGGPTADITMYRYFTTTPLSTGKSTPGDRCNLSVINNNNKTFISVVKDNPGSGDYRVFTAYMDHTNRRIVALCNRNGDTVVDRVITVQQSAAFNNTTISSASDLPTFTHSIVDIQSPSNSENVISMAPFVSTSEACIIDDVFVPAFIRNAQDMQQFDIGSEGYIDRYISSGASVANGKQFVVRFATVRPQPNSSSP